MSNTHKPIDSKRRAAVLGSLGGAAAVTAWHKPLVNSVVLPAHAQASVVTSFFASGVTPTIVQNKSVLDYLVEPAVAGDIMLPVSVQTYIVVATQTDDAGEVFDIGVFESLQDPSSKDFSEVQFVYEGSVSTQTGGTLPVTDSGCVFETNAIDVEIVSVSEGGMELNFTSRMQNLVLEPGAATLPTPVCTERALADSYFQPPTILTTLQSNNSLLDALVPEAHAGLAVVRSVFALLATKTGDTTYTVQYLSSGQNILRSGSLDIGGADGTLEFVSDECLVAAIGQPMTMGSSASARITDINPFQITVEIDDPDSGTSTVFAQAGVGVLQQACRQQ